MTGGTLTMAQFDNDLAIPSGEYPPESLDTGLVDKYGHPYYKDKNGDVIGINQSFWAGLHNAEHIQFYDPDEKCFYRYGEKIGIYGDVTEHQIMTEISERILQVSRSENVRGLETKRTATTLGHIVAHLKGICEKRQAFQKKARYIHLPNGVLTFNENNEDKLLPFSPGLYSRNCCPIVFNKDARCDRFLNELLLPAVTPANALIIQKYIGLCLLGKNLIQRVLILDGLAGRGKTTLSLIIQKLIGQINVTQLRTEYLNERFELFRFLKKTLLVGVDVPGDFLSTRGAIVLKGLVGGDFHDAERKGGTESFPFVGDFCVVITSNSRLHIRLDGDLGAWYRRLLICRFEAPAPAKKIPNFADLLIQQEGSGILNWALEGLAMILKDVDQFGDIQIPAAQEDVITALLAESDSLRHFLKDNVDRDVGLNLSVSEIVERYAEYCQDKSWNPKPITSVYRELEGLMLELFGTSRSHSINRGGRSVRGFSRVRFKLRDLAPKSETPQDDQPENEVNLWKD